MKKRNFFQRLFGLGKESVAQADPNINKREVTPTVNVTPTSDFIPPPGSAHIDTNPEPVTTESKPPTCENVAQETMGETLHKEYVKQIKRRAGNGRFVKGVGGLDHTEQNVVTGRFQKKA